MHARRLYAALDQTSPRALGRRGTVHGEVQRYARMRGDVRKEDSFKKRDIDLENPSFFKKIKRTNAGDTTTKN